MPRTSQNGFRRATVYCATIAVFACAAPQIQSQSAAAPNVSSSKHAFDVVSIKPDPSGGGWMNFDQPPLGSHWSASNVTIKWMIEMAFEKRDYQLSGQPAWVNAKRYDVEADIGDGDVQRIRALSRDEQIGELRAMVLSLLTDRCKLSVTHVTRQLPSYAISATKDAPSKLKTLVVDPFPNNSHGLSTLSNWGNGKFSVEANKANLADVINGISRLLDMPVADETDIQGNYSFTLRWTDGAQAPEGATSDTAFDRTLGAALRDQLGLKLEPTKASVDTIMIDHIEEPTPN